MYLDKSTFLVIIFFMYFIKNLGWRFSEFTFCLICIKEDIFATVSMTQAMFLKHLNNETYKNTNCLRLPSHTFEGWQSKTKVWVIWFLVSTLFLACRGPPSLCVVTIPFFVTDNYLFFPLHNAINSITRAPPHDQIEFSLSAKGPIFSCHR